MAVSFSLYGQQGDVTKGRDIALGACSACHALDGNGTSPENQKLAQQIPQYLVKQLADFENGQRGNSVMQAMASPLSQQDSRNVAAYWFSGNKPEPPL